MIPLRDNIPSRRIPFITWSLIAANIIVFYLQVTSGGKIGFTQFVNQWAIIPKELFSSPETLWYTVFTAMFLHGGWMHIIGNMVFLYIFGDNVEDRMGHFRFIVFYFFAGSLANLTQTFVSASSPIPLIGASGAIAGILGSYFFFYPHARVLTLIPLGIFSRIVEVPAFIFLGIWFLMQSINSAGSVRAIMSAEHSGGIAWFAHAGGFVVGLLLSPIFADRRTRFK